MHLFNTPPGWPPPPTPEWRPPPGWRPDPSWPPAPAGWRFWVNERGSRTLGPQGAYGSVGRGKLAVGGAVAAVAFLALLGAVAGDPEPGTPLAEPAPGPTVTFTVTQEGAVETAPPATVTAPPATVTLPRATVTVRTKPLPQATVTTTVTRPAPIAGTIPPTERDEPPADVYYDNCSEARAAGAAPIRRGEPGYGSHLDRDNDGIACE